MTIGSLPANAVSYYESGDVSVIFSIPTVSFGLGQGDEDHMFKTTLHMIKTTLPTDAGRRGRRCLFVAAPPTRGRDRCK